MFGARADNERTWLQFPDQNYLSWSFGVCVLAAFLAIIAFMAVCTEFYRLWLKRRKDYDPDESLTTVPPPKTSYIYSEKKIPSSTSPYSTRSQAGYLSRYSNQGSQSSLNMKSSNTANSGGEIYINHLSDFDENRQRGRLNGYVPQHERRQISPEIQEKRPIGGRDYTDSGDSQYALQATTAGKETSTDYEESKKIIEHPVLPEYVPKSKNVKKDLESTLDESFDSDLSEGTKSDEYSKTRKSRSNSKSKKSAKNRSDSEKRKRKKGADTDDDRYSESGRGRQKSKKHNSKNDASDDEWSRSHQRSKKSSSSNAKRKSSRSRERSSSRHRSHSRDLNSSYSDTVDSDSASVGSRSRKKHRDKKQTSRKDGKQKSSEERTKKGKHKRSSSGASHSKKKYDASYTDDFSGSEYSSKQKSKKKGDRVSSTGQSRSKSQEFSDTESTRSKQSKQGGRKPKHSYSSYYEY